MVKIGSRSERAYPLPNKVRPSQVLLAVAVFVAAIYSYVCWFYLQNGGGTAVLMSTATNSGLENERKDILGNNKVQLPVNPSNRQTLSINSSKNDNNNDDGVVTIGYFISITGCGARSLADGAAVVKHSVHLASIHGPLGGHYDYRMHAIYHPSAASCVGPLAQLGYDLVERDTPVAVQDIQGEFLRRKIVENGCCGEKELIKLEAYTFTQYPVVVHLDLDVLVLKPIDPLFDAMILGSDKTQSKIDLMWPDRPVPDRINAFFTRDFGMVRGGRKYKPVQGGFLVLRPDQSVYQEYVDIIRKGDFREGEGWGGQRVGPFFGSMTIQGIIPYYYDILHPNESVDLNRCVYDQMCDNPRDKKTVNEVVQGKCRTGEEECEDCRSRNLEDIVSVHFTICQKPWLCLPHSFDKIQHRLCRKLHFEWYRVRSDLEQSWGRSPRGPARASYKERDHFFGYCTTSGQRGYVPIAHPYGVAV